MHFFNIKPTAALLLALTTANVVVSADMHHRSHIHRRIDVQKRAGASYNETEAMLSRSVEMGHQVTSVAPAGAASSASTETAAAVVPTSASAVVEEEEDEQTTTVAGGAVEQVSSTSIAQQTSVAAVTTSVVVATTDDVDVVTSTATADAETTPLAAATSVSSSATPITISTSISTSSTPAVLATTSTSTSTVDPTTSTLRSTVTPTQETFSSAPSLVKTSARTTVAASASVSAASGSNDEGSSKLSVGKTAMIVIIVVASVIVGALAIWTIIRKWKLGPSKKFDERMQPLDFSPHSGMPDPFLEKTRNRYSNSSVSSADRQRRQFVSELDAAEQEKYAYETQPNYLHGVPSHDFTAPATGGVASSNYTGGAGDYDPYGYPPHGTQHDYSAHADETVGGNGYADLRRGPSTVGTNFAGMGAGAGGLASASAAPPVPQMSPQHAPDMGYDHQETRYSDNPGSLGRPTQGEGPYFAASQAGQARRY